MLQLRLVLALALITSLTASCGGKKSEDAPKEEPKPVVKDPPKEEPKPAGSGSAAAEKPGSGSGGPSTPMVAEAPEGNPPADGKYEKVMVEGKTVPMINVMEKGTVVLVDTDGVKPRSWEEQYKKKNAKKTGQFDLHKTDSNKNGKFDDDAIDKEGIWVIDVKGNIVKH
jgi:hypothetical protein